MYIIICAHSTFRWANILYWYKVVSISILSILYINNEHADIQTQKRGIFTYTEKCHLFILHWCELQYYLSIKYTSSKALQHLLFQSLTNSELIFQTLHPISAIASHLYGPLRSRIYNQKDHPGRNLPITSPPSKIHFPSNSRLSSFLSLELLIGTPHGRFLSFSPK